MEKKNFFVSKQSLDYDFSNKELSNYFEEDHSSFELPTVSYLNTKYDDETYVPITLFNQQLTPFQALVKYLRETLKLTNKETATALNRNPKTTWSTYNSIKKKKFIVEETEEIIPLTIFSRRELSAFECLVVFLKEKYPTYSKIARVLNKDPRTVWTVFSRAKKKLGENHEK